MKQWLISIFLLLFFFSEVQAADYREVTDDTEITGYFSDHTLKGIEIDSGNTWTEYYDPNGKVCYQFQDSYAAGRWLVKDSQVCFIYSDAEGVICYNVLERKDLFYMGYSTGPNAGEVGFVVTERISGNSEYLGLDASCRGGGT